MFEVVVTKINETVFKLSFRLCGLQRYSAYYNDATDMSADMNDWFNDRREPSRYVRF